MNKNTKNLIWAVAFVIIGFGGPLAIKFLPLNIFSLILLLLLNVCKFGGLILLVVSIVKIFSKRKIDSELTEEQKIIKKKRLLTYSIIFYVLGLLFSFSSFIFPYLCGVNNICAVISTAVGIFIFIPLGIVFIIIGSLQLRKFLKIKNA
jgi:hypothetical protein